MSTDHGAASATKPHEDSSPMEFNPYSDSFFDDPYETYRWMRDEAPVYYSERWDFYALTRHEDVVNNILVAGQGVEVPPLAVVDRRLIAHPPVGLIRIVEE